MAVAALLVLVVLLGQRGSAPPPPAALAPLEDDLIVSAAELKNRREVSADDFRPRGPVESMPPVVPVVPPSAPSPSLAESLADRRARRAADPDDVLTLRAKRQDKARGGASAPGEGPWYDGPIYITAGTAASSPPAPAPTSPSTARPAPLAAAGTALAAVLVGPVELQGDSSTAIARVTERVGVMSGARFIGTATSRGGRVQMRFRSLVLADGRQVRVDGEAQDETGAFGLAAGPTEPANDGGDVIGSVAQDTATDLVATAVGSSLAGRALGRVAGRPGSPRAAGRAAPTISIASGTQILVFLHDAAELRP